MKKDNQVLPKSPYPYWLSFTLLHPWRKIIVQREKFIKNVGIKAGDNVLELGCGPGFFTEYIAKVITKTATVFAQDVQPQILLQLKKRMLRFTVNKNIIPILSSSESIPLEDNSIDFIFAANVFEEIEKENLLDSSATELKRLLKKNGRLCVIEHRHGVTKKRFAKIYSALTDAGFKSTEEKLTPFMHFVSFIK